MKLTAATFANVRYARIGRFFLRAQSSVREQYGGGAVGQWRAVAGRHRAFFCTFVEHGLQRRWTFSKVVSRRMLLSSSQSSMNGTTRSSYQPSNRRPPPQLTWLLSASWSWCSRCTSHFLRGELPCSGPSRGLVRGSSNARQLRGEHPEGLQAEPGFDPAHERLCAAFMSSRMLRKSVVEYDRCVAGRVRRRRRCQQSIWPSAILFAIMMAASRLVPHARCRSTPGVLIDRPESITDSRARFQSL